MGNNCSFTDQNQDLNPDTNQDPNQAQDIRQRNIILSLKMIFILFVFVFIIGLAGFSRVFNLGLVDSIHNTSMYITGMGPITLARNNSQKLFAAFYAILAGFVFLAIGAFLLSEIIDIILFPQRNQ